MERALWRGDECTAEFYSFTATSLGVLACCANSFPWEAWECVSTSRNGRRKFRTNRDLYGCRLVLKFAASLDLWASSEFIFDQVE
jgi:hypothetical protein